MTIKRYPIEIELTNYCGLECVYCVNKDLTNKWYLEEGDYDLFLDYVLNNINNILYVNIAGIGDIFLHPNINNFLIKFIKTFKNTNIDVLLSTKGLTIGKSINLLKQFKENQINLNISIGLFSFNPDKHDEFTQRKGSFKNTLNSVLILKKEKLNFSLELLVSKYSISSLNQFMLFWKKLGTNTILHKPHNFWWRISLKDEDINEFWLKDFCDFSWKQDKKWKYYRDLTNCNFIPFVDIEWNFNLCSLSAHSWKELLYNLNNVWNFFDNYIDLVENFKELIEKQCINCSLK